MGALQPIRDDAPSEVKELAETLRSLFSGLGTSIRRYGVRCNRDPGSVTRYLNGSRVPPRAFIDGLLRDLTLQREEAPTRETQALLDRQYLAALKSLDTRTSKIHVLEDSLAQAEDYARRQELHVRALERDLIHHQERLAEVVLQIRQLRSAAHRSEAVLAISEADEQDLHSERETLREQVQQLQEEVEEARRLRAVAEKRCVQLEEELALAESDKDEQQARVQAETEDLIERVRRATEASQAETRRAEEAEQRLREVEELLRESSGGGASSADRRGPRKLWIIEEPLTVRPDSLLSDVVQKVRECNVGSFPVTSPDGALLGIITSRDLLFEEDHRRRVDEVMTPMPLVTGRTGIPTGEAVELLRRHKIEKLPIVDKRGFLRQLITMSRPQGVGTGEGEADSG
ncbi:CBS domain-containing protein [Streptomyces sp. cg28]|uniref:CBS domain-containing protein n=1 Tax=Streptomyces sp. cg28 TaxID=3403457 RepID=UPI003B21393D